MSGRIAGYTPKIPAAHWAAIEGFVRAAVTDAAPSTPYRANKLFSAVTPFVHWAWMEGQALDRESLFMQRPIERFIHSHAPATWSDATRANQRSVLFSVGDAVLGADGRHQSRVLPIAESNPSAPYSVLEVPALRSWAASQITEAMRRDAWALLTFGMGAGLGAEDIVHVRVGDVTVAASGAVSVTVTDGRRPRSVTVLAGWEQWAADLVADRDGDDWLILPGRQGVSKNACNRFVTSTSGLFKANTQRLRATWIVHHLTVGTPLPVLMAAAGVTSVHPLERFLGFVPAPDADAMAAALRGNV